MVPHARRLLEIPDDSDEHDGRGADIHQIHVDRRLVVTTRLPLGKAKRKPALPKGRRVCVSVLGELP